MANITELVEKYITPHWKRSSNNNIAIKCPFHKGGMERRESFFINVENGLYFCHTCHIGGNIISLLNELNIPKHIIDIETSDLKESIENERIKCAIIKENRFNGDPYKANPVLAETVLLDYKNLPTTLINKGFNPKWLKYMEIGIDNINQRIIYPIRDVYGNLAGVSGGALYPGMQPKYLIYRGGYKDNNGSFIPSTFGEWFDTLYPNYKLEKSDYLWNFDRVYTKLIQNKEQNNIFIVEGFKACLWMLQHGYTNTIALMGSYFSQKHFDLLTRLNIKITLFLDNDPAGRQCSMHIIRQLFKICDLSIIDYPENKIQPDDFTKEELFSVIENKRKIMIKDFIEAKKYKNNS